jgi:sialidase-1
MRDIPYPPIFVDTNSSHSMRILLLIAFFASFVGVCHSQTTIQAEVLQKQNPVLVSVKNNVALCLKVNVQSDQPLTISELKISTRGTTCLSDVKAFRLFSTGSRSSFVDSSMVTQISKVGKLVAINKPIALHNGDNYLWVALELNEKINLLDRFDIACPSVKLSDGKVLTPTDKTPDVVLRAGYAVRQRMQDGVNTYRIPGLVTTKKGTLISVFDIRHKSSGDLQGDIDIGICRSKDGGKSWLPMQVAVDMGEWGGLSQDENGVTDPSILVDETTGTIWIACLWLHGSKGKAAWWASKPGMAPDVTGQLILAKSDDDGLTWSKPINVTEQMKDPKWYLFFQGPGRGITMKNGTIVFPAQFKDENQIPHSTIIYSKDHGKTWSVGTGAKSKTTEAQVVELSDGSLMLNMRDDRGGFRSIAVTSDMGKTWVEHSSSRSALPESTCMGSIITLKTKKGENVMLFSNPNTQKGRHSMTIKVSFDEGKTWTAANNLLYHADDCFGYSCLTQIDDKTVGVLYEGVRDLYFQKFTIEELLHPKMKK